MEAIVLAGGLGTRLRPLVQDIPKCMVPVKNRPFLEYLLDELATSGIHRIILSVGYLNEQIISHFGNQYRSMELVYAVEETPLGTGGGILRALRQATTENVFVLNGDTLFRMNLREMQAQHHAHSAGITLGLRKLEDTGRFGRVVLDARGFITGFAEKGGHSGPGIINGGIYLMNKNYVESKMLPDRFSFEKDFLERFVAEGRFLGFPSEAYFIDIGIPEDYERAQQEF